MKVYKWADTEIDILVVMEGSVNVSSSKDCCASVTTSVKQEEDTSHPVGNCSKTLD